MPVSACITAEGAYWTDILLKVWIIKTNKNSKKIFNGVLKYLKKSRIYKPFNREIFSAYL